MPWPSKYGTAASQTGTPPAPPPERDITSHGVLSLVRSGTVDSFSGYAPYWNSPTGLIPYLPPVRPAAGSGVLYPPATDGTDRKELLLQVKWPIKAIIGKPAAANKTLISVTVESRPQGSASWRTNTTTIFFDSNQSLGRIRATDQAYSFTVSPGDEYRAFASYTTGLNKFYSPISSGASAISTIRPTFYSSVSQRLARSGSGEVLGNALYKLAVSLLSSDLVDRIDGYYSRSGVGSSNGNQRFYSPFADRINSSAEARPAPLVRTGFGNTSTILSFSQWV